MGNAIFWIKWNLFCCCFFCPALEGLTVWHPLLREKNEWIDECWRNGARSFLSYFVAPIEWVQLYSLVALAGSLRIEPGPWQGSCDWILQDSNRILLTGSSKILEGSVILGQGRLEPCPVQTHCSYAKTYFITNTPCIGCWNIQQAWENLQ